MVSYIAFCRGSGCANTERVPCETGRVDTRLSACRREHVEEGISVEGIAVVQHE